MSIDRQQVRRTMKLRRGMVDPNYLAQKKQAAMQNKALSEINDQSRLLWSNHTLAREGLAVQARIAEALEAILAIARAEHGRVDLSKIDPRWYTPATAFDQSLEPSD